MKRLKDESFDDYKKRRIQDKLKTKKKLKGQVLWPSMLKGTYKNELK